ncbi:hypothetical protein ACL9RL_14555 [Plantibacter sp. Mn2098]|uniref:hypothetical protein n=1 Tax=Plantibacter sp. Mn2098 TaxID=3395266 RepID=UPI003BC7B672
MQLGTRWAVGSPAPETLPAAVADAVSAEEAVLATLEADTSNWRWTLTWLERRPIVELDDGTRIVLGADGSVSLSRPDDEPTDDAEH